MTCRILLSISIALALVSTSVAQGRPGGGGGGTTRPPGRGDTPTPQPRVTPTFPDSTGQILFLSGKVVADDGTELTDHAAIQSVCRGQVHTETYTDSKGSFSFEFRSQSTPTNSAGMGAAEAEDSLTNATAMRGNRRDWRECELRASMPGFTSEILDLGTKTLSFGNTDVGRIVLHRMGGVSGLTVSATTAAAPHDAKKAFEKALDKAAKNHPEDAQKLLEKAVQIYPKFAAAWYELGRLQVQENNTAGARQSFQQAIAADSKYANPYLGLAHIASRENNWREVVDVTNTVLALNPVNFPGAWLLNAAGYYTLQNLAAAEKSAREGVRVDTDHHLPKLEYVLGVVLMQRRNYPEATLHMKQYMALVKDPAEVAEAQKRLAEINQSVAKAAAPPQK